MKESSPPFTMLSQAPHARQASQPAGQRWGCGQLGGACGFNNPGVDSPPRFFGVNPLHE